MKTFNFQFCEKKKLFFGISLAVLAIGLIFNIIFGAQLDIQFSGGAVIKYSYSGSIAQEDVEKIVKDASGKDVSVRIHEDMSTVNDPTVANNSVSISFAGTDSISLEQQQAIAAALDEKHPDSNFEVIESSSVNPTMGRSFLLKCAIAILIAFVLLIVYVGFRFKKIGGVTAGIMAIIALLHDVLIVYFTFVVFRMPINDSFMAVVLTILGYSLNNTIIIYDRIRENRRLMGPKATYAQLVDTSINQTLTRSIFTSLSTFIAIAAVFVVGTIYGLSSVTTFALPMMVGVVVGCYSSIFIAGPLYVAWHDHKDKKRESAQAAETK
ncbi:protein translocase subunit SecF [Clostridium sp. D33t1_170424_F3]|uniref:protein translocase subunit SecF n=1 Tax=Clostridium sp. D33t1_170424_F3 TaxID=2787099 RepID=UPI0018A981FC|nr:protein translocase subunit SecF [Clostridium sp. D33t1_170424_F3]